MDQFRVFDGHTTLVQRNLNVFYKKGYRLREWAVSQDGSKVVALMEYLPPLTILDEDEDEDVPAWL